MTVNSVFPTVDTVECVGVSRQRNGDMRNDKPPSSIRYGGKSSIINSIKLKLK